MEWISLPRSCRNVNLGKDDDRAADVPIHIGWSLLIPFCRISWFNDTANIYFHAKKGLKFTNPLFQRKIWISSRAKKLTKYKIVLLSLFNTEVWNTENYTSTPFVFCYGVVFDISRGLAFGICFFDHRLKMNWIISEGKSGRNLKSLSHRDR